MTHLEKLESARLRAREKGFTLVELAIVLVIIGLIIGGVLVGQDLIKAAEIRATISQIESYNAAVNTFRGRYNGIPGDIRNVEDFFDTTATWTEMVNGDGDRILEACDATTDGYTCTTGLDGVDTNAILAGEVLQFWHHLSAAELIGGYYDGLSQAAGGDSGQVSVSFPPSKLDRNGVGVYGAQGKNYYQIGAVGDSASEAYDILASLTPEESFNLDSKMDDGKPGTGSVIVRASASGSEDPNATPLAADGDFAGSGTVTACINDSLSATATTAELRTAEYALLNLEIACTLRLRMN